MSVNANEQDDSRGDFLPVPMAPLLVHCETDPVRMHPETLRATIASRVLVALLTNHGDRFVNQATMEDTAARAVHCADALLVALERQS